MKKNKKILLTIITILISAVLFTNKVNATYMYLECDYDKDYKNTFNIFVRLTDGSGSKVKGIGRNFKLDDDAQLPNSDGCWIPDITKGDENCKSEWENAGQVEEKILSGICPAGIRMAKWPPATTSFVPIGEGNALRSSEIKKEEFIFYSLTTKDGQKIVFGEGYNQDGLYANINAINGDDVGKYQLQFIIGTFNKGLYKNSLNSIITFLATGIGIPKNIFYGNAYREPQTENFWKVSTNRNAIFPNYLCAIYGADKDEDCYTFLENKYGLKFDVIIDSNDSNGIIANTAQEWYKKEMGTFKETSNAYGELIKKNKLIEESAKIRNSIENGTKYSFPENYRPKDMFEDLKESYDYLKNMEKYNFTDYSKCYTGTNEKITPAASLETYAWTNIFSLDEDSKVCDSEDMSQYYLLKSSVSITDKIEKKNSNSGILDSMFYNSLSKALKNISTDTEDILSIQDKVKEYVRDFTIMISYIDGNYRELLTTKQEQEIDAWRKKYEEYAASKNIVVVTDCAGLLGQDLIDKVNSYLNIIKIAVPIILIAFGIVDFSKAIFAAQEEQMKKAQKNFIKRLIIAIIIFFVPTVVNLILQLANKVWPIIESSSCKIG